MAVRRRGSTRRSKRKLGREAGEDELLAEPLAALLVAEGVAVGEAPGAEARLELEQQMRRFARLGLAAERGETRGEKSQVGGEDRLGGRDLAAADHRLLVVAAGV